MGFDAALYNVDDTLFAIGSGLAEIRRRQPEVSTEKQIELCRKRVEEITRNLEPLADSCRQLRASTASVGQWHEKCNLLLLGVLKNCYELETVLKEFRERAEDDAVYRGLMSGIEQVLDTQMQQLVLQGMIQEIMPDAGEKFNELLHKQVGTAESEDADVGQVVETMTSGYVCRGKVFRRAGVIVAVEPED